MQEMRVRSLSREDPRRGKWQPAPVFLSGKPLGQRSLVGYSPWGHKESDVIYLQSTHAWTWILVDLGRNKVGCYALFFKTVFLIFWENSIETCILSRVKQITSPGWMHETSARACCTGKTQRDRVEREVGVGIRMGNTCRSMADSCLCMTKTTTIL